VLCIISNKYQLIIFGLKYEFVYIHVLKMRQCTYIVFILQCLIVKKKKQLANCVKRAETDIVLSALDVRAYSVSFSASLEFDSFRSTKSMGTDVM
jgi:hypothetical protein